MVACAAVAAKAAKTPEIMVVLMFVIVTNSNELRVTDISITDFGRCVNDLSSMIRAKKEFLQICDELLKFPR